MSFGIDDLNAMVRDKSEQWDPEYSKKLGAFIGTILIRAIILRKNTDKMFDSLPEPPKFRLVGMRDRME